MPRVVNYTPSWLSKPAPAHELFVSNLEKTAGSQSQSSQSQSESSKRTRKPGPRRTITCRGTEVFIAVGKEIRWADLVYLKTTWEDKRKNEDKLKSDDKPKTEDKPKGDSNSDEEQRIQGYRTIKTTVADDIRQLIISPNFNYLAILTTHTVHIALLPDSSHLTAADTSPLRLKTFTLGPVTHVTSQSAVVSALWHPLGVNGSCIVTVTEDAVVRVWELSTTDRWSFDRPTLAIDLKKLADGTTLEQDFSASYSGMNKGFSPDSFEMEVASSCFASRGSGGWSPMTLWVAMRGGDVYALCPLLPERFAPPPTLIPSLSVAIVEKAVTMEDDPEASEQSKLLSQQQLAWMSDLDNQDPVIFDGDADQAPVEIYTRPAKPGRVPKLQGPLDFDLVPDNSEDDLDYMLCDILVIGPRMDTEGLMCGEDEDIEMDADQEGLSAGVICLLSSSGRITVCLDLLCPEAQWLPSVKTKNRKFIDLSEPPCLLTIQILQTLRPEEVYEEAWPTFSRDVTSRYSFFTTHASGITFTSLSPWVFRLESELQGNAGSGTDFRLDVLVKSLNTTHERVFTQNFSVEAEPLPLAACLAIRDPDLGYFLLSANSYGPVAATFESPDEELSLRRSRSPTYDNYDEPEPQPLLLCAPRPVYQPPTTFTNPTELPKFLEQLRHSKYKRLLHEPIRLSPATLSILTDAHKLLSEETHRLGTAAAELFRRCERLQMDLRNQITRANEVACRVEAVVGDDTDINDSMNPLGGDAWLVKRIEDAKERQQILVERLEKLRRTVGRGRPGGRELSDKEKMWIEEVSTLSRAILPSKDNTATNEPWQRFETIKHLKEEHVPEAMELVIPGEVEVKEEDEGETKVKVPTEIRKQKYKQVMELLEREGALVEGAKGRLERLSQG